MRWLALIVFTLGCGGTQAPPSDRLSDLHLGKAPDRGFQLVLPIVRGLTPGSDNEICTWTDKIAETDLDVKAVQGFQSPGGHHVVLYSTKKLQQPGTQRPCTEEDMASFRFAAGAGGEGQADLNEAPGDLVYRIEKGSQIVLNHHYINASAKNLDAQSAANVFIADPSKKWIPASSVAFVDTTFKLPRGKSSLDIKCTLPREVKAWFMIPHMHRWGTHIDVDLVKAGKADRLFAVDWKEEYTFHPPEIRKDPKSPLMLARGDEVRVHCDWDNTEPNDLTFGLEMCVAFAAIVDDTGIGNLACDRGEWGPF